MSHADSDYEKTYVMTYKELIFTFLVFVVILFVLYPKDLLKEQILSEENNYDLSMLYLKNLIEQEPENESLMLILAEQSLRSGKKDLSLRLLELLLRSEDIEHRNRATLLSYDLKKDDYFYLKDEEKKLEEKAKLTKLYLSIVKHNMYDGKNIDKWYKEATFLGNYKYMNIFVKQRLLQEPNNVALLKQAYYISLYLNKKKKALEYVTKLSKFDSADKDKWEMDGYYLLMNNKSYAQAEKLLTSYSQESIEWKKRYADFYLMRKSYIKSSAKYMEIYHLSQDYNVKKEYFIKAVDALQAGGYPKKSASLAKQYESLYIHERQMRKYFLKLYIATGDLEKASSLSSQIFLKETR